MSSICIPIAWVQRCIDEASVSLPTTAQLPGISPKTFQLEVLWIPGIAEMVVIRPKDLPLFPAALPCLPLTPNAPITCPATSMRRCDLEWVGKNKSLRVLFHEQRPWNTYEKKVFQLSLFSDSGAVFNVYLPWQIRNIQIYHIMIFCKYWTYKTTGYSSEPGGKVILQIP